MIDLFQSIYPTILRLTDKIPFCTVWPSEVEYRANFDWHSQIEITWTHLCDPSLNLKCTSVQTQLFIRPDKILHIVGDFKYTVIEWTDPQCIDKITQILEAAAR